MKLDFTQEIKDLDGKPIKDAKDVSLTLKAVAINALLTQLEGENPSGEEKAKSYALALKINDGVTEVSIDEAARLKAAIGKLYTPLVVGRAFELLEGK